MFWRRAEYEFYFLTLWIDYTFPSFLSEMETQLEASMIGQDEGLTGHYHLCLNRGGGWFLRIFQHWYTLEYFQHL